jgi:hypothetical protein
MVVEVGEHPHPDPLPQQGEGSHSIPVYARFIQLHMLAYLSISSWIVVCLCNGIHRVLFVETFDKSNRYKRMEHGYCLLKRLINQTATKEWNMSVEAGTKQLIIALRPFVTGKKTSILP